MGRENKAGLTPFCRHLYFSFSICSLSLSPQILNFPLTLPVLSRRTGILALPPACLRSLPAYPLPSLFMLHPKNKKEKKRSIIEQSPNGEKGKQISDSFYSTMNGAWSSIEDEKKRKEKRAWEDTNMIYPPTTSIRRGYIKSTSISFSINRHIPDSVQEIRTKGEKGGVREWVDMGWKDDELRVQGRRYLKTKWKYSTQAISCT